MVKSAIGIKGCEGRRIDRREMEDRVESLRRRHEGGKHG